MTRTETVGGRLAQLRKLAGLTQAALAARAHLSTSLVKQVEQGRKPASPSFTAAVARALGLSVVDLYGQPYLTASRYGTEQARIPELERALMEFDQPLIERTPPRLDELQLDLGHVVDGGRRSRYAEVLERLPDLLRHLHAQSTTVPAERERTHRMLAHGYQCAMFTAYKLGHLSLSAWAAERVCWAGDRSGDPLWATMGRYCRAQVLMFAGSYPVGQAVLTAALTDADDLPDPDVLGVRGAIHLTSSILAARSSKPADSDAHLAEARDLARHVPSGDPYDHSFSRPNVDIHSVAAAVEMADGTTALSRGRGLRPDGLYPARVGHYHLDLARAFLLHGDRERALGELTIARRIAPQQTRYHPQVRETVYALAEADRRSTESLRNFAAWIGLRS